MGGDILFGCFLKTREGDLLVKRDSLLSCNLRACWNLVYNWGWLRSQRGPEVFFSIWVEGGRFSINIG